MKTGFIGLGHLGSAMANRLISEGVKLTVWNRTREKATALGVPVAESPAKLISEVDILFFNLFDSEAVTEVINGKEGLLEGDCRGKIVIDTTTNHFSRVEDFYKELEAGKIKKYPVAKAKKYIPDQDDIKKVFKVAKPIDRLYLLVIAHTLGRITAVNRLKWEDVTPYHITLYTRKARNSDLKAITIPMNRVLAETVKQIPRAGEYLFINPKTSKPYEYRKRLLKALSIRRKFGISLITRSVTSEQASWTTSVFP